jgi:hypothetical protein
MFRGFVCGFGGLLLFGYVVLEEEGDEERKRMNGGRMRGSYSARNWAGRGFCWDTVRLGGFASG